MNEDKTPAALAIVGKAPGRKQSPGVKLPRSPEVDESALKRAETEIENADKSKRTRKKTKTAARWIRRKQREEEVLYIKGPRVVIEAFTKFKEEEQFKANWDALLDLLERSGVKIEDFDA